MRTSNHPGYKLRQESRHTSAMYGTIQPALTIFSQRSKGFTLIEIMIVVAIIGILAAIAYPSYLDSVRKARRTEARGALQQMMQVQERYYSVRNTYLVFDKASIEGAAADSDLKRFKWWAGENSDASYYELAAQACAGKLIGQCVSIVATRNTGNVKPFDDPICGNYQLQSDGIRNNSPAPPAGVSCW